MCWCFLLCDSFLQDIIIQTHTMWSQWFPVQVELRCSFHIFFFGNSVATWATFSHNESEKCEICFKWHFTHSKNRINGKSFTYSFNFIPLLFYSKYHYSFRLQDNHCYNNWKMVWKILFFCHYYYEFWIEMMLGLNPVGFEINTNRWFHLCVYLKERESTFHLTFGETKRVPLFPSSPICFLTFTIRQAF